MVVMRVVALPLAAGGISLLPQWMLLAQRGDGKRIIKREKRRTSCSK